MHPDFDVEATPATADAWFAALDQRLIEAWGGGWITEITGVHTDGADWWIQLAGADQPEAALVLHLTGRATVGQALEALRHYSREEFTEPQIVHVTRAA